ncbi:EAL domain-containing protein [Caldimonas brevitalea]|uniref:Diguanylate phosphodiesterase n=1 Tax=Caldimonas brevitalea TaxID=413882 RepID=A0A0G3BLP5_9BURK|nr:EAL domain-containing protein [Caldimonas brevitalea]AKJ30317.1 diguanylate phosphodiesterase [Caldimonas brevitalea]
MDATDVKFGLPALERDGQRWTTVRGDLRFSTHFQPIYSLSHRRAVGHEALLRAQDGAGNPVSPLQVLASAAALGELLEVDRVCRWLHANNFASQRRGDHWLFVNVHPAVFARGPQRGTRAFFNHLSEETGLKPSDIVLEVTEEAIGEDERFGQAVALARELGCLLALDDFGAGHSNFDRVWNIRPEIVKLDRSVVRRAAQEPRVARVVAQMVSLLHECGALVVCEGIETLDEGYLALESDVDFVQGYLFGRPAPDLCDIEGPLDPLEAVWQRFDEQHVRAERCYQERLAPYLHALGNAAGWVATGRSVEEACRPFLALPAAELCYLLDERGLQVGHNVTSARFEGQLGARFAPLADARQARWAKRPYFRRALENFGRVQVTRPYLTVHGARLCVTASVSLRCRGQVLVLGGDISWEGE